MLKRLLVKDMGFDDPETKKEVFVNKMELKNGIFEILETRFSGQNLMTRVFTFVLIFKTNFLKKTFKKRKLSRAIQLEVQNISWTTWITWQTQEEPFEQQLYFSNIVTLLHWE